MNFKKYADNDYEAVCYFLIELNARDTRGIAKAVIHEALSRAKRLGAKRAFVISDMDFYSRLGFRNKYHYMFYQSRN